MSKKHENVPEWAMEIFEDKLHRSAFDVDYGFYHAYAGHPDPDSTEMWRARIRVEDMEDFDKGATKDPTTWGDAITLDEFEIYRVS